MATFFFISNHEKEANILKTVFEQFDINVIISELTFSNYIQTLQTKPDLVFLDMPSNPEEQVRFVSMMKKNKTGKTIPILGYGNQNDKSLIKKLTDFGLNTFLRRPLKFNDMTAKIHQVCKLHNDTFTTRRAAMDSDRAADIKFLLDKSKPAMEKIDLMVGYVDKLLAFPFTVAKVINVTSDSNSSAAGLAKAIEADPVITATILKVSNTVVFASRDREITSVKDAIIRVGFMETRNIALSLSVMTMFDNEKNNLGFDKKKFWYHSLATGLIAEKLAKNCGYDIAGEAFLAGLLHDFGVILMDEFFSDVFQAVMERTLKNGTCFVDEVDITLGISHNDVAEQLFEKWKLPAGICYAVKNHVNFQGELPATIGQQKILTEIVGMANLIAKTYMLGEECDRFVTDIDGKHFKNIKAPRGISTGFLNFIHSQLNIYNKFLNLDPTANFPITESEIENAEEFEVLHINLSGKVFSSCQEYLKTQGYAVSTLGHIDGPVDTPHVCVIEAGPEHNLNDITSLITRVSGNDNKIPVPVIVIHSPESELKDAEVGENIVLMPSSVDLRTLDQNLIRLRPEENAQTSEKAPDEDVDIMNQMDEVDSKKITRAVDKLTLDA